MTSRRFIGQKEELENLFRRYGIGGEISFHALAYHYFVRYSERLNNIPDTTAEKWRRAHQKIENDLRIFLFLDELVLNDPEGHKLSEWYQFFIGRRFREASGKFFTPKLVASVMARILPVKQQVVIMDPTCGSSTFLMEAARVWGERDCILVANDIELSLVELSMLTLNLGTSSQHEKHFICGDIYSPPEELRSWYGRVDYILANPPFSLRIEHEQFDSPLFSSGYRNSDALFIDIALKLLRPGGRLVCLLPHSIIANKEFSSFRTIVEKSWTVLGVICLPEGVFHLSAGTTTRADIVVLEKNETPVSPVARKHVFASVPSVGIRLNSNDADSTPNYLESVLNTPEVREAFGI
jgi:type I restriction-modification system DNA methylase subunit